MIVPQSGRILNAGLREGFRIEQGCPAAAGSPKGRRDDAGPGGWRFENAEE